MSDERFMSECLDMRPGHILFVQPEPAMPDCPLAYYEQLSGADELDAILGEVSAKTAYLKGLLP